MRQQIVLFIEEPELTSMNWFMNHHLMNRLMNRFVIDEDEDYDLMKVFHLEQTLDAFKKGELAKGKGSYKMKYKIKCE